MQVLGLGLSMFEKCILLKCSVDCVQNNYIQKYNATADKKMNKQ